MKTITKLTKEQESQFKPWIDKWIKIGLKTGETDFETFEKYIKIAYKKSNLKFPGKIIRVQSPMVGAFASAIATEIINSGAVHGAVSDAVDGAVDVAVHDAVHDAVHGVVSDAVSDAVHDAVSGVVGDAVRGAVHDAVHGVVSGVVSDAVSDAVRDAVDGAVDGAVDVAVHDAVHDAVHGVVSGAVRGAVDGAVDVAVHGAVSGVVGDAVRGAVHDAVHGVVSDAVRGAVSGAVDGAVRGAVDDAVSGVVSGAVKKIKWHDWFGGQFWVGGWWGSSCFASFFVDVCKLELTKDIFERYECYRKLCESVNYFWCNSDFVMVCARPVHIDLNNFGRLHSESRKAIEYPDGWGLYFLNGIRVPEWLVTTPAEKINPELALTEKNADVQREIIRKIGAERLLKVCKSKTLDDWNDPNTSCNYKLVEMQIRDNFRRKYLVFQHVSITGITYAKPVPPETKKASHARAWILSMVEREQLTNISEVDEAEIYSNLPLTVS